MIKVEVGDIVEAFDRGGNIRVYRVKAVNGELIDTETRAEPFPGDNEEFNGIAMVHHDCKLHSFRHSTMTKDVFANVQKLN